MAGAIAAIAPEWWVFILLVILLYLVLGTFLTPSEIILVTVPVLLPVAKAVGVHPIHFGMVCVIASAIGHITPPVGLCLFVGMAISGLPQIRQRRRPPRGETAISRTLPPPACGSTADMVRIHEIHIAGDEIGHRRRCRDTAVRHRGPGRRGEQRRADASTSRPRPEP